MEEIRIFKNLYLWLILVILIFSGIAWFSTRTIEVVDTGLIRYQEFQEIYNTINQINQNVCNIKQINESDKMFKDVTKSQQILALQNQANRWIGEYNAKSNLINFNIWKSESLPKTLNVNQFDCL